MISLLEILDSPLIRGIANGSQLVDLGLNLSQISDEQKLVELIKKDILLSAEIQKQNKEIIDLLNIIISKLNFNNKEDNKYG